MGAEPWSYFVPYQEDVGAALQALREREFRAGRFYIERPTGRPPVAIEDAREQAGATGTRSILDIDCVSETPSVCAVSPLPKDELLRLFDTEKPSRETVERLYDWESVDRGQGIYIIVFKDDKPNEIFFAGYSFD